MSLVERVVPGEGQESVWDYPRPPRIEPTSALIEVRLGEHLICRTKRALRVLETSHPPTYYLPLADFQRRVITAGQGTTVCEWKGVANYLDITGPKGTPVAKRAAWGYPNPHKPYKALRGHVGIYAGLMDLCTVDGEQVIPQPGGFYGGWITSRVVGPFKGVPGSNGW